MQLLACRLSRAARTPGRCDAHFSSACCRCATMSDLLSEMYHPGERRLLGNFPQALSHLALVNTALGLSGPVLQRGGG